MCLWGADSKRTILFKICKYIFRTYIQRKNSKDVREAGMAVIPGPPAAPKALLHLPEGHLQTPSEGSDNPRAGGGQSGSSGRQPPHRAPRCLGSRMAKEWPSRILWAVSWTDQLTVKAKVCPHHTP